ncbi:putative HAD-superfamily hydrolase, subfamily IIB [Monocercomonoides exilis]|uniref:putative HAD-superfamily hydrolase, subfamily IIB n=1 Tax=Monocercomonoides exilis TaxID=2049356 RepID=UPI00355A5280|nr:putative HAD-superfamily hydrolase, subfamily IIB [Monocercomonoides exilis]|eukprot:MONOS_5714.1-p1 / transcript=MONOS_5714.1 / gene=MONOS_5714 / organism=Monocercomonoides_exilis_PA203 / gene_product=HAD-superfamily hydrolase, subfamily IIB / transcript_product=HAD-superfamily hydrolase, subfamily IIB / location=Mono_scaffold00170:35545-36748(+) / protein_length=310 / sequence_SO=supercontig / SO=protein_coding / is_pseudo=false
MTLTKDYKVLSCDLDDTLLREDMTISKYDSRILRELQKLGVNVVLSSGRRAYDIENRFKQIGLEKDGAFIIGSCGCEIVKVDKMEPICTKVLSNDTINVVVDYAQKNNLNLGRNLFHYSIFISQFKEFYYSTTHLVYTCQNPYNLEHLRITNIQPLKVDYEAIRKMCLESPPTKLFITEDPIAVSSKILPEISKVLPLSSRALITKAYFCEVIPTDGGKGPALQWLCRNYIHCEMDEVVSIGDSANDVDMLEMSGLSFAPSNSFDVAKKAAKEVLNWSNMESAVGRMVNRVFFNGTFLMTDEEKADSKIE